MAPEFFGASAQATTLGPSCEELEYDLKPPRPNVCVAAGCLFARAHSWYMGEGREHHSQFTPVQMAR